jgi:hypothetical protein
MPRRRSSLGYPALLAVPLALALGSLPARALPTMPTDLPMLVQAQAQPQAQSPAPAGSPATGDVGGFSQDQLESYADAVVKIQEIDRAWQPRIDQAQDQEEAEVLTTQATDAMVSEIQAQGLSVQEYNTITQAAEKDERLYQHIVTLLAQR